MARTRYLLFLDESGTHDMKFVDPNFPAFVLAGLLVGETLAAYPIARAAMHNDWSGAAAEVISRKLKECVLFP